MPLKISQRNENDVPTPSTAGKINEDVEHLKTAMRNLAPGMVLEIEVDSGKAVRGTKLSVSKAAKQIGSPWTHWHVGTMVFARPTESVKRRTRRSKAAA